MLRGLSLFINANIILGNFFSLSFAPQIMMAQQSDYDKIIVENNAIQAPTFKEVSLNSEVPTKQQILEMLAIDESKIARADIRISTRDESNIDTITAHVINTKVAGVYPLFFQAQGYSGQMYQAFINFVVGEKVIDNRYVIFGKSFNIPLSEVEGFDKKEQAKQILAKGNVRAFDLSMPHKEIAPQITSVGGYIHKVGAYEITLTGKCSCDLAKDAKKIYANVYERSSSDGDYFLEGEDKTLPFAQVKLLLEQNTPLTNRAFFNITAWEKNNVTALQLQEGVHYTLPKELTVANLQSGTYPITFQVGTLTQTFTLTVLDERASSIIAQPELVILPLNKSNLGSIFDGVTAIDGATNKKLPITATLMSKNGETVSKKVTNLADIDTKNRGLYIYEFQATDTQNRQITATRHYIVDDNATVSIVGDFVFFAEDYNIADIDISDTDYLAQLQAEAKIEMYQISTGQKINPQVVITDNPYDYGQMLLSKTQAASKNTHDVGPYPVTITVEYNGKKVQKTIIINVLNETVVYKENDVALHQQDAVLRRSQVMGKTSYTLTKTKVWDMRTGRILIPEVDYQITDDGFDVTPNHALAYTAKGYHVVARVPLQYDSGSLERTANIKVVSGEKPKFILDEKSMTNNIIAISKDEASLLNLASHPYIIGASDFEDSGTQPYQHEKILFVNATAVTMEESGIYFATYQVTDADYNVTTQTLAYLVDVQEYSTEYAIFAHDHTVQQKELQQIVSIDNYLKGSPQINLLAVRFVKNELGELVGYDTINKSDIQIENKDNLNQNAAVGAYNIRFSTGDVNATILVHVISEQTVCGVNVCIEAQDALRRPSEIKSTDVASELTQVKAWEIQSGRLLSLGNELIETTAYTPASAWEITKRENFAVQYTSPLEPTSLIKNAQITIHLGEVPRIYFENDTRYINLFVGDAMPNVYDNVKAIDAEDGEVRVGANVDEIDVTNVGATKVTYATKDSDGNMVTATRIYYVHEQKEETSYIIQGVNTTLTYDEYKTATATGRLPRYLAEQMQIRVLQLPHNFEVGPVEIDTSNLNLTIIEDEDKVNDTQNEQNTATNTSEIVAVDEKIVQEEKLVAEQIKIRSTDTTTYDTNNLLSLDYSFENIILLIIGGCILCCSVFMLYKKDK